MSSALRTVSSLLSLCLLIAACSVEPPPIVTSGGDAVTSTDVDPGSDQTAADAVVEPDASAAGETAVDGDQLSDEEYCLTVPDDAYCDDFFNNLSDEDYCRLVPDDAFCDAVVAQANPVDEAPAPTPTPALEVATSPGLIATAGIDPTLTRPDGQCLPEEDAESDLQDIEFNMAYQVVDGQLGAICFGSPDPIVESAWRVLADLVPPGQLRDLGAFAGFTSNESEDAGVTLAFVQALTDEGDQYLMAVNIVETQADPDEANLTMAHEFAHVFTAMPTELDRTIFAEDCTTFDNGEGCYNADSIMNQWFLAFWQQAPGDPTDQSGAAPRCQVDAGFFGEYAASTPEEDFAEAFSAYVMRVEARTDGQRARIAFIDNYPGLREFRDRATQLGYGPLAHNFDACG